MNERTTDQPVPVVPWAALAVVREHAEREEKADVAK